MALTDAGRAIAEAPPRPTDSAALHELLFARVSRPQRRIVESLIEIYPESITKVDLAAAVEASASSSSFTNNLGALRTLGLIDYPVPGEVQAQPVLFLEEAGR